MIVGNDTSTFQGQIDFNTLKNNANFVLMKASEGTGFTDSQFKRSQSEARRVGLPLGYYHFARPDLGNTPQDEANWFLSVIGNLQEGEVLALDYEVGWSGDVVAFCKAFLDVCSVSRNDTKPLIYLNQSLITAYNWKPVIDGGYGLWVAAYTYNPNDNNFVTGLWPFAAIQQWTDKQLVPGIVGATDGDAFFGDAAGFKAYGYKTPPPPPPPVDPCQTYKDQIVELQKQLTNALSQPSGTVTYTLPTSTAPTQVPSSWESFVSLLKKIFIGNS